MGDIFGGGGGGSGMAKMPFMPPGQGEAAGKLPGLVNPMYNQATNALGTIGDTSPAARAYPFVTGTTDNVLNNQYQGQALGSSLGANDYFTQNAIPAYGNYANQLSGFGNYAAASAPGAFTGNQLPGFGQAQDVGLAQSGQFQGARNRLLGDMFNPVYQSAINAGQNLSGGFQGAAQKALGDVFAPQWLQGISAGQNAMGQMFGDASRIRQEAFDPQNELYDRSYQRTADRQNAINAQSGIASSPYGAGVAGETAKNFELDWRDRQLGRQISGGNAAGQLDLSGIQALLNPSLAATQAAASDIGAAGSAASQGINLLTEPSLAASRSGVADAIGAEGLGSSALSSLLGPANAQLGANAQAANTLGSLANTANLGYGTAPSAFTQAATGAQQFGRSPYDTLNSIQGQNYGALQNEINLGNAAYQLPQQTIGNLMQYLGLGQTASGLAGQIAGVNNQIGQTNFNQLASGLGGASQLLGIGGGGGSGGGLLSGLFGGGGGLSGLSSGIGGVNAELASGLGLGPASSIPFADFAGSGALNASLGLGGAEAAAGGGIADILPFALSA